MASLRPKIEEELIANGDHMGQPEFHRLYASMPEGFRAELIGGIVFEPSPLGWSHGEHHGQLMHLLRSYSISTPGTGVADNVTVILGEEDEVQPDVVLRIVQETRGKSRLTKDDFVQGPPELVAEIANSSKAIDLHRKKSRYALSGVTEYIVVCLKPKRLFWFELQNQSQLEPSADGIVRSNVFPGLWIHARGLLSLDDRLTIDALERGIQSREHCEFISDLGSGHGRI